MSQGFSFRKPGGTAAPAAHPSYQAAPAVLPPVAVQAPPPRTFAQPAKTATVSAPPAGIFRGIGSVRGRFGASYFEDGTYWIRLDRCKYILRPGSNAPAFVIEATVLRVTDDPEGKANKPGTSASQMILCSWQGWMSHIKAFVCAAESMTVEEGDALSEHEWEEALGPVFGEENPFQGRILEMQARKVMKKSATEQTPEKDKWFTQHNYKRRVSVEHEVAVECPTAMKPDELAKAIDAERRELAALNG